MRSFDIYGFWLKHDRKVVKIDGVRHVLKVEVIEARYPRREKLISVQAEVINKRSAYYQNSKAYMGDDWTVDLLGCDSVYEDVLAQAQAQDPLLDQWGKPIALPMGN